MQNEMKQLLDQLKRQCGDEPAEEVWYACITLGCVPDLNALLETFGEVMERATEDEMAEISDYMVGPDGDDDD